MQIVPIIHRTSGRHLAVAAVIPLLLLSTSSYAVRGRVHMDKGLLLTDYNTILRGVNIVGGDPGQWNGSTRDNVQRARDEYGLNCIHIYGMDYTGGGVTSQQIKDNTDNLVAWTRELEMYVVIVPQCDGFSLHCFNHSSESAWEVAKRFWDWMAPRYKDETHVIYEFQNEPRTTPDWMNSDGRAKQNQIDGYNLLRDYAPETHIMLWDFSGIWNNWNDGQAEIAWNLVHTPGIDFSNASIGLHCGNEVRDPNNPFRKFVDRLRAAEITWTATETDVCADGSNYGKWWCPHGFEVFKALDEMDVGWLSFHHLFNITPQWKSMMDQYGPKWNPDFGSWPLEQVQVGTVYEVPGNGMDAFSLTMSRNSLRLVNAALAGGGRATIFNANGRTVVEGTAAQFQAIRLDGLAPGAYFVRTVSSSGRFSGKFVLSK